MNVRLDGQQTEPISIIEIAQIQIPRDLRISNVAPLQWVYRTTEMKISRILALTY
jgi:hypothetical protein